MSNRKRVRTFPFEMAYRGTVDPDTHCENCGEPADAHESVTATNTAGTIEVGVYGIPDGRRICGTVSAGSASDDDARALRERLRGRDVSIGYHVDPAAMN